ncbi:MAG: trypsin-like serine protease [Pseudomonadota bacterium]
MKSVATAALTLCLLAFPACDAVRVPGGSENAAPEIAPETTDALETTDNPVLDQSAPSEGTVPIEDSAPETPVTTASAPGTPRSLPEINARICGTTPDLPLTPTVAARAGVTVIQPPAFGTATVNGLAGTLANFPGVVKLEPRSLEDGGGVTSGHCGATRIARNWFVTAAHCVDDAFDELRLITGSETLSSPLAQPVSADLAVCHGGYGGLNGGYANDIALVKVNDLALENMADVPIARFGTTARTLGPATYPDVEMAGWGLTGYEQGLSNELLSATLTLSSSGPATIGVVSRDGAGPCVGDSGGPLYITEDDGTKTVVGVLSIVEQNRTTGEYCAGDYGGSYTNLQGYADWIERVVSTCAETELCE